MKFPALGMIALALTSSSGVASSGHAGSTLRVRVHFMENKGIAQVNRDLARRGIRAQFPEVATLDLSKSSRELNDSYWKLFALAKRAQVTLDAENSIQDSCFTGSNVEVADSIDKLGDGWLSDQFQLIGKATKNPDHVGILYSQGDDGTDRNWLNIERCSR